MIIKINNDNKYLSTKKEIPDLDFIKWNRSIYEYEKI